MTHTEILANLEEIENVAKMACEEAKKLHDSRWEIDPDNLDVVQATYWVSKDRSGYDVTIDGARQDGIRLSNWFEKFFLDRGYKNPPEFRFEWW